eukprot:1117481-Amphidinium_carterae.1
MSCCGVEEANCSGAQDDLDILGRSLQRMLVSQKDVTCQYWKAVERSLGSCSYARSIENAHSR